MVWRAGGGNMKTVKQWFKPSLIPPGPFDLFVFHSIWNYPEVQKVIPKSAIKITILRDPIETFESGYSYFGRSPKVCQFCILEFRYSINLIQYNNLT